MKNKFLKAGLILLLSAGFSNLAAQELTAYEIMKKADNVEQAKCSSFTAKMTLKDKKGQIRLREIIERSKEYADQTKSVIVFTNPKDVSGVGYLMYEYKEDSNGKKKDSDNWLYMPAMKKVRRISGSESSGDFMGTDFTYDDMGDRGLSKDEFTLLGTETIDGILCYKIEAKAKDATEKNPRRILWIGTENFMMYKSQFFDRQNQLQRILTVSGVEKVDGYWTRKTMLMENVQKNHSTLLELSNIDYQSPLEDSIFTVNALENERIR